MNRKRISYLLVFLSIFCLIFLYTAEVHAGNQNQQTRIASQSRKKYSVSKVKLSVTRYAYDGNRKKPSVKVYNQNGNSISSKYYTVKYASGRKYVGKYKVTVKMKGKYSGTYKKYFYIVPKKTSFKKISSGSESITVKWHKRSTQASGYQIQRATNSSFTKNVKNYRISSTKTTSKKLKGLSSGKKYYVRIRTYKNVKINGKTTKIYSKWSERKSITTKAVKQSILNDGQWITTGKYQVKLTEKLNLYYRINEGTSKKIKGYVFDAVLVSDKIYYVVFDSDTYENKFYVYDLDSKKNKYLMRKKTATLMGYYDGYLYYRILTEPFPNCIVYKYNVSTGKSSKVSKLSNLPDTEFRLNEAGGGFQYGNYIFVLGYRGDPSPTNLWSYNMKTGKLVHITDYFLSGSIINRELYFSEEYLSESFPGRSYYGFSRCRLDGSDEITLAIDVSLPTTSDVSRYPIMRKNYALIQVNDYEEYESYYLKYHFETDYEEWISEEEYNELKDSGRHSWF